MVESSFVPYCLYLKDMHMIILWSTFFNHAFDFYIAFDMFKMPLTIFVTSSLLFFFYINMECMLLPLISSYEL